MVFFGMVFFKAVFFAPEKILFNVVLILLGQHCTGQNPMQCCAKGSRQNCTRKIQCNIVLNTHSHWTTLHREHPYAMLFQRLQTTLPKNKSRQCRLNYIWSLRLHIYILGPSCQKRNIWNYPSFILEIGQTARLHETRSELKPVWNFTFG